MKITQEDMRMLAEEPELMGQDLRVWLFLCDYESYSSQLAKEMGLMQQNVSVSLNRLYRAGWLDHTRTIGSCRMFTARAKRNPNTVPQGQMKIDFENNK